VLLAGAVLLRGVLLHFRWHILGCTGLLILVVYTGLIGWILHDVQQFQQRPLHTADLIMVFGAHVQANGQLNRCLAARVQRAAQLYHAGYAPYLLMSGGINPEDGLSEADTMQRLAIQAGVPASRILRERASHNTYENLKLSQPLLQQVHAKQIIMVSDWFHLPRINQMAQAQGYAQRQMVAAYADNPCWYNPQLRVRAVSREPLAIVKNVLKGYF
jgi:uncharacterized SAM-binding protein YcdF (DUF218 family)